MLFLFEKSEEELTAISNRLGSPDVESTIDNTDLNGQAMKRENLEANNLQIDIDKLPTDKSQLPEVKLESGSEINVAHSS